MNLLWMRLFPARPPRARCVAAPAAPERAPAGEAGITGRRLAELRHQSASDFTVAELEFLLHPPAVGGWTHERIRRVNEIYHSWLLRQGGVG